MDNYCPKCGQPTTTDGKCGNWKCNTYQTIPVLPQWILKLKGSGHPQNSIINKINEIIDVVNDMRGQK